MKKEIEYYGATHLISNPQSWCYKYSGALHHSHQTTEKPLIKNRQHHEIFAMVYKAAAPR